MDKSTDQSRYQVGVALKLPNVNKTDGGITDDQNDSVICAGPQIGIGRSPENFNLP